jgi:hypothetical protein
MTSDVFRAPPDGLIRSAMAEQTGGKYFSNIQRYGENLHQVQALTGRTTF